MLLRFFLWYATPEDFDELGNLRLKIETGRLRHRWAPRTKGSAIRYLKHSIEGAGLRAAADKYILVKIICHPEESPFEDLTDDYPNATVEGLRGVVIRTPIDMVIPEKSSGEDIQPVYYESKQNDVVFTTDPIEIQGIGMGLMSPEEITEMSVVEVITADSFKSGGEKLAVPGGVHDPRMGTIDKDKRCPTCRLIRDPISATHSCPGHFGRIELPVPIPNVAYLGFNKYRAKGTYPILNSLNNVCHSCGEVNLPITTLNSIEAKVDSIFENNKRNYSGYNEIKTLMKIHRDRYHGTSADRRKVCPHCGQFTPLLAFSHSTGQFYIPVPDKRYHDGTPNLPNREAHSVLKKIPNEHCKYLGLDYETSRPENLFFTVLPVAPITIRPEVNIPGVPEKGLDDLTRLYQDVVSVSEALRNVIIRRLSPQSKIRHTRQLYHAVSRVYDNQRMAIGSGGTSTIRGFSGAERAVSFKGIMNRLRGKEGRFRNNLQSKYVEDVSYSVITPDSALSIDEVGIPIEVAMESTVLERVTPDNIEKIRMLLLNGPYKYPGAVNIIPDGDASNHDPANIKAVQAKRSVKNNGLWLFENEVIMGSLIERHVMDGDYGLFNRPPSLHRQSVLAFRARVRDEKSLGMNPTVCIPFNADYDGDAMKFHFVQSEAAQDEARRLMALDKNIIHARYGKLTVATDQDQTSGLYLLTHTDMRRKGEWNKDRRLGFTDKGIPYVSKEAAIECYSKVFSEIRNESELKVKFRKEKAKKWEEWKKQKHYRTINTLPESDVKSPTVYKALSEEQLSRGIKPAIIHKSEPCYTGRALFNHLFTVLDAEYVSATYTGNTPKVDENGEIVRKKQEQDYLLSPGTKKTTKDMERIIVYKGKLIQGTIEKDSFGEGGASLAPAFIYHEGYEKGQAKLTEYIEMVTRLGLVGHTIIGFTMGVSDVGIYDEKVNTKMSSLYEKYSSRMEALQRSWYDKTYEKHAKTEEDKLFAATDPTTFVEEKIFDYADEYEKRILEDIEDVQGAGNPMQISVRSKARGKDENVRQMGGSFGLVLVGGKRITSGINANRTLPHFPLKHPENGRTYPLSHPIHAGFVKSGYSKGMSPTEYWFVSTGGRRSTVESAQGQIAESGYLERKMIKAMEPIVVNDKKQIVNTRTGRIISPLVGDDGLAPYHIRGSHKDVNKDGHVITLQPLLFEFECKHGKPLEENHVAEMPSHRCLECSKGSDIEFFRSELKAYVGLHPSKNSTKELEKVLLVREMTKPNLRKMTKKFFEFYQDSICRTGEAIGATAGGCLGEPATQAALRSFHFAGKMSFQGSVKRTKQILESPLSDAIDIVKPRTLVPVREKYNSESIANKVAAVCRVVTGEQVIKLISYDVSNMSIIIQFDEERFNLFRLDQVKEVVKLQIKKAIPVPNQATSSILSAGEPYVIRLNTDDQGDLLRAKESIMGAHFSGIGDAKTIRVLDNHPDFPERFVLDIRDASRTTLNGLVDKLYDYLEVESLRTNNISWIHDKFGMESALWQIEQDLDFQMNGGPGAKGVGEYDYRYTRMICDLMGEEGKVNGLGPQGMGAWGNYSALAGASLERVPDVIMGGAVMGNFDNLQGPAEAIIAGSTVLVGDYVPKAD